MNVNSSAAYDQYYQAYDQYYQIVCNSSAITGSDSTSSWWRSKPASPGQLGWWYGAGGWRDIMIPPRKARARWRLEKTDRGVKMPKGRRAIDLSGRL